LAIFAAAMGVFSCGTTREVDVSRPLASGLRGFLLPPLTGWSETVEEPLRIELDRAFGALVEQGNLEVARAAAGAMLARVGPEFAPALVLLAQVELASADPAAAKARLLPVAEQNPHFVAAQLLLGRVAELTNDPWTAWTAYRAASGLRLADERLAAVRPAALQRGRIELDQALARGRVDQATHWRDLLAASAPDEELTIDAARAVAAAAGDQVGELEALRGLAAFARPGLPLDRGLLERRAELEMAAGEAGVAVDLYSELGLRYPDDPAIREGLAAAQFRFRLTLLPAEVEDLTAAPTLTRGDFATLLYWLVPGARGGRTEAATIVTDVPEEHPQRVAIVRVVNLGLLPLEDTALRRFDPDSAMSRGRAMRALLLLASRGSAPSSCLQPLLESPRPSIDLACQVASRCGWLDEPASCLPEAPLDGPTAERMLRLAFGLLGD
jgi:hypothetical protein